MNQEELARAEERLRHPAPGSKLEAAQKFGIDLTLLMRTLRLTPEERGRALESHAAELGAIRGIANRHK